MAASPCEYSPLEDLLESVEYWLTQDPEDPVSSYRHSCVSQRSYNSRNLYLACRNADTS